MDSTLQIMRRLFTGNASNDKIISRPLPVTMPPTALPTGPSTTPPMAPPIQPRQNAESLAGLRRNPPRKARRVTILDSDGSDSDGSDSEDVKRPVK